VLTNIAPNPMKPKIPAVAQILDDKEVGKEAGKKSGDKEPGPSDRAQDDAGSGDKR